MSYLPWLAGGAALGLAATRGRRVPRSPDSRHPTTLLASTSSRALWRVKYGSKSMWLITDHTGRIDEHAPLVAHQRGNYFRARDAKAAWKQIQGGQRVARKWVEWAQGRVHPASGEWSPESFERLYKSHLPALEAAYERASPQEQERIAALDAAIYMVPPGQKPPQKAYRDFIAWAQTVVPGFGTAGGPPAARPLTRLPYRPVSATWLEPPPPGPLYTGVRDFREIIMGGFHGSNTADMFAGDEDPEYPEIWKNFVYDSYRRDLNSAQRKKLKGLLLQQGARLWPKKGLISKEALAENTSLLWVTYRLRTAQGYQGGKRQNSAVLELDPRNLAYFWWFADDFQGESSLVFVLPNKGPQALHSAFKVVEGPTK